MNMGYSPDIYTALGNPGWTPTEISRTQLQQAGVWPAIAIDPSIIQQFAQPTQPQQSIPVYSTQSPQVPTTPASSLSLMASSTDTAQKQQQAKTAQAAASSPSGTTQNSDMGGLNFGEGAFPNATQAAFGGMGGQGLGYGGFAQGATVSVTGPTINIPAQQQVSPAPSGSSNSMIIIGAAIMLVILAIVIMGRR